MNTAQLDSTDADSAPLPASHRRHSPRTGPIGLFDSGIGGLSVLRAVAAALPAYDLIYFADQKFCPYGPRPVEEIRSRSRTIMRFLLGEGCQAVVIACNTATAAALQELRTLYPDVPIVGMEPAIKPAARSTQTGKIAVLATPGTIQGELYSRTSQTFAANLIVRVVHPPDWVELVEEGDIDSPVVRASVTAVIGPLVEEGFDRIVLGCTHYPFLSELMREVTGERAEILDPSSAVAQQTARVVDPYRSVDSAGQTGMRRFITSGDPSHAGQTATTLLGYQVVFEAAPPSLLCLDETT